MEALSALCIFACLTVGATAYKLGRRLGYDHGYHVGALDEHEHCRPRGIKMKCAGWKAGFAHGMAVRDRQISAK